MADDTLLISFQNNRPLPVAELGKLLEDLAADYKRTTGSDLVLANIVTGSTLLFLKDALSILGSGAKTVSSVVTAANNLAKFSKTVRDYLSSSKKPPTAADVYQHQSPVMKSAERLAKISIEQNAAFGLKYHRDDKGESVEFNYQPSEAAVIRENIKLQREMRKDAVADSRRAIAAPIPTYKLGGPDSQDAREFIARVPALGPNQSEHAVLIWINILKAHGFEWLLPTIADDFEGQGNAEVARIIRTQISGDDKESVSGTE